MITEKRAAIIIFLVLLFCYAYFPPRWAEWNQNSRMDLTLAIVEQGRIQIDDYYENTGDYAVYEGHIYTDKAPGTSLLGVPFYFLFKSAADTEPARKILLRISSSTALADTLREGGTGLLEEKVYFAAALYVTTFFTISLPSALMGSLLFLIMGYLLPGVLPRFILALGYGLGTIVFPYSTVFYGHQIAAALIFSAFYLLYQILEEGRSQTYLWLVGVLFGVSVLTEFPSLILMFVLVPYILLAARPRTGIYQVILGGLPFAMVLGAYNYLAFGSPISSSYRYLGRFPEISNTGFLGFSSPSLEALSGITFSPYRGLFFYSPFLILAIPGFWYLIRNDRWRREGILWLGMVSAQLILISAWYDWRGGFSIGPRNLLVIMPYLTLAAAYCIHRWKAHRVLTVFAWLLVGISFLLVWISSVSGQEFPPIVIRNPFLEFHWPRFIAGDITRNIGMFLGLPAWFSLIPIMLILGGSFWVILRGTRSFTTPQPEPES